MDVARRNREPLLGAGRQHGAGRRRERESGARRLAMDQAAKAQFLHQLHAKRQNGAIVQGDADLRVCDVRREAIISIAEAQNKNWFSRLFSW